MPNNPHRSNLTARLADSQEQHARRIVRPLNVVRVQTAIRILDAPIVSGAPIHVSPFHEIGRALGELRLALAGV